MSKGKRIEDMTPEEDREYRWACIDEIHEFLDFHLEMEFARLESLEKMTTSDLAMLAAAVDQWREREFGHLRKAKN